MNSFTRSYDLEQQQLVKLLITIVRKLDNYVLAKFAEINCFQLLRSDYFSGFLSRVVGCWLDKTRQFEIQPWAVETRDETLC